MYNLKITSTFKTKTEDQARYIMELYNKLNNLIICETSAYDGDLIKPCAVCGVQITPNDVSIHHARLGVDVHYLCSFKDVCGEDISSHCVMWRNGHMIPHMPRKTN